MTSNTRDSDAIREGEAFTDQQIYDKFSFLEGLVSERRYRQIADTAIEIARAASTATATNPVVLAVAESLSDANQPGNIEAQISHLMSCVRDDVLAHDGKIAARSELAESRLKVLIGLAVRDSRAILAEQSAAPMADVTEHLNLLQEVLDAKEVMLTAGCKQASFGEMFSEFAALPRASEQADEAVTELIAAADDVLRNGHQHDVGGGDVFLGTCDSTERLQRALDAVRTKEPQ